MIRENNYDDFFFAYKYDFFLLRPLTGVVTLILLL